MKEAYCSYEVSKLLKEKGFDSDEVGCHGGFYSERCYESGHGITTQSGQEVGIVYDDLTNSNLEYDEYLRPTHQMACAWLREIHQLHISVNAYPIYGRVKDEKGRNTCGLLYWNYIANGEWMNDKYNPQQKAFVVAEKSHEQVVEAALKYALENLI